MSAALALVLAAASATGAPSSARALAVFGLALAMLMGVRPLLVQAADGGLDMPAAVLTRAAAAAWLRSRDRVDLRPWLLALCANLLFHLRWQQGLMFAIAVLVVEADRGAVRAALGAASRTMRSRSSLLLVIAAGAFAVAGWVAVTGGGQADVAGVPVSVREIYAPLGIAALAVFGFA